MTPETITAIAAGISTIVTTIGGIIIAILLRRVKEVHTLVNSEHDAAKAREEKLIATLQAAGIKIPKDESLRGTEHAESL